MAEAVKKGPKGATSRQQETVHVKAGAANAAATLADVVGAGKVITEAAENELKETIDRGPLGSEANSIRYTTFGASSSRSIAGVPELQDFTATVAIDATDKLHLELLGAAIGTEYEFATRWKKGTGVQVSYAAGTLASREDTSPEGGPRQVTFTFSLAQDWKYLI